MKMDILKNILEMKNKELGSYHQGISWPWLLGLYYNGLNFAEKLNIIGIKEKKSDFIQKTYETYEKMIQKKPCVGGIAEINNSIFPYDANGAFQQAWSNSEIIRIVFE